MRPEFLNVDLDLESVKPLDELVAELGDNVHVLHNGPLNETPFYAALEINEGNDNDPDSIIVAFCQRIEALSPAARTTWKKCTARRFDIGVMSGTGRSESRGVRLDLQSKTLARIAALSAQLAFTIYPKATSSKS